MTEQMKNAPKETTVEDVINSLDQVVADDTKTLIEIATHITGHDPKIWNVATIGFDSYHYKYDSGREGDSHVLGFYPRKDKITFYLMDGTDRYSEHLAKLGKHTISKACVYIKRLSDVNLEVLEEILSESYRYMKQLEKEMNAQQGT